MTTDDRDQDVVDQIQDRIRQARHEVQRRLVGQERVLDQVLACLLADGNALVESTPGLGKTMLIRTLAEVTDLSFSRIQNTPDLMPSDITGTEIIRDSPEGREFVFEKGPIFANVVLADEINRATPKTQAALLEAMQERQVTAGGETWELPDPFFILATQNPIEQEGSLHPEESLYMNGSLQTASEALEYAKENGELIDDGDTRLYDVDATTQTLTPDGELVETDCMVYETDYIGEIYTFETKTGRTIRVSGNHPFLVNRDGVIQWEEAQYLEEDDSLVTPRELSLPSEPLPGHDDALTALAEEYTVVRRDRVAELVARLESEDDLSREDLDALRIAADLSKTDLATRLEASYDQVLNFFQGADNGINQQLAAAIEPSEVAVGDHVEAFTRHQIDDELTGSDAGFFVGFVLAEGTVGESHIEITQKNLPVKFDQWVEIAESIGLDVALEHHDTGRVARINSKPFVDYLDERFDLRSPEQLLSAPAEFRHAFLEIFLLTESHFDTERRRITFVQKDRETTNLISHLLLGEGIVPWVYEREDAYELRIQGEDVPRYCDRFEWRGPEPTDESFESAHRTVPLPDDVVSRLVDILGMKHDERLSDRSWYNSYNALQSERNRMATPYFEDLLTDVEETLASRQSTDAVQEIDDDLGRAAKLCGLSMTDIAEETDLSKHRVWQAYQSEERPAEATEFVAEEYTNRIAAAEVLTDYLRKMTNGDVFYDRITSVESERYTGPVIGLSVPEHHNYVAGLGGCGISHNTYPLPEAQTDRFMAKILVDYPDRDSEREIVDRFTGRLDQNIPVERVLSTEHLLRAQELVREMPISEDIRDQAVDLVRATREADRLEFGASPRASMGLVVMAKARAFMKGRSHVAEEDLLEAARPVLRHRVVVDFRAEREGITPDDVIADLL